jgi:hypothetical protein
MRILEREDVGLKTRAHVPRAADRLAVASAALIVRLLMS